MFIINYEEYHKMRDKNRLRTIIFSIIYEIKNVGGMS